MDRPPRRATVPTDLLNRPRASRRLSRARARPWSTARANVLDDARWHTRASQAPWSAPRLDFEVDSWPPHTFPPARAPLTAHRPLESRPADTAVDPAAMSLGAQNHSVRRVRALSVAPPIIRAREDGTSVPCLAVDLLGLRSVLHRTAGPSSQVRARARTPASMPDALHPAHVLTCLVCGVLADSSGAGRPPSPPPPSPPLPSPQPPLPHRRPRPPLPP